jgi:nicotinate dehydrogenase subunit A
LKRRIEIGTMIPFVLNGRPVSIHEPGDTPLLEIIRNRLGLFGTRFGCGAEQCGCCMILVDGRAEFSCTRTLDSVAGRTVTTVEGLGTPEDPHALQQAFLSEQAGQCGYCLSGMLIGAAALLEQNPDPTDGEIRNALERHLCRCGAHNRIVRAVMSAAASMREDA